MRAYVCMCEWMDGYFLSFLSASCNFLDKYKRTICHKENHLKATKWKSNIAHSASGLQKIEKQQKKIPPHSHIHIKNIPYVHTHTQREKENRAEKTFCNLFRGGIFQSSVFDHFGLRVNFFGTFIQIFLSSFRLVAVQVAGGERKMGSSGRLPFPG